MKTLSTVSIVIALSLVGCAPELWNHDAPKEIVLKPGESVSATNKHGTMTVTNISTLRRKYAWDHTVKTISLIPRDKRWYGSLGMYSPGDQYFGIGGIRIVAEEGEQHFKSVDDFLKWRSEGWQISMVYNNSGLGMVWSTTPSRNQVNVDVWQILIAGKIPKHLPGAQNSAIKLVR
ncbi:MAG: hypothetical protein ABI254_14500 [Chthoniobacterales bacterium]